MIQSSTLRVNPTTIHKCSLLSGWGEPNSAISDDEDEQGEGGDDDRRFWTCWCAAHRPAPGKSEMANADQRNTLPPPPRAIIILEFELERDIFNPLYPPFQHEQMSTASPESVVSNRSSSTGGSVGSSVGGPGSSTATTFSFGSSGGSLTEMQRSPDATPANVGTSGSTPASVGTGASTPAVVIHQRREHSRIKEYHLRQHR